MLLGSDELTSELAIALRRLGAEVIEQSATEADELSAVIGRLQPEFVVTVPDAIPAAQLEALGNLTELVPSARSVRLTADRESLRRLAADELGLPTAPFWFAGSIDELEAVGAYAGYPLLVKPVAGPIGRGQSVVAGPEDIAAAWQHAVGHDETGAHHRVMAEAVVEVEVHVTLLAVRSEGPKGPAIEFCSPIGHDDVDAEVVECWQPQKMSTAAMDAAKSVAARIVKALGGHGVFGVELMINGDEVYFADVTIYPRESAWVTLCSQRLSAFELQARAILGLPVDTMMISPGACQVLNRSPEAVGGWMPTSDALTGALRVPESDVRVFGRANAPDVKGKRGITLATGPDLTTARERAREAASRLNVRDSRG
ncbi:MAG: phosphoribosylglycinamide formyltransferase 2 [Mycobacterium sp.]|nr:phosphoribosylglycinamide formyltransferase 2 [Mycobacterium sp.]